MVRAPKEATSPETNGRYAHRRPSTRDRPQRATEGSWSSMAPEARGRRVAATRASLLREGPDDHGHFETVPAHSVSAVPIPWPRSSRCTTRAVASAGRDLLPSPLRPSRYLALISPMARTPEPAPATSPDDPSPHQTYSTGCCDSSLNSPIPRPSGGGGLRGAAPIGHGPPSISPPRPHQEREVRTPVRT
jgi:hypothetical protein